MFFRGSLLLIAAITLGCGSAGRTGSAPGSRHRGTTEPDGASAHRTVDESRDRAARQGPGSGASHPEPPFLTIDSGGHLAKIKAVMFTRDGRYLVSAGYDKAVRVFRTDNGALARTLRGEIGPGKQGRIYAAALSSNDRQLALGGWLGAANHIRLVDFHSGAVDRIMEGHRDVVLSLSYGPDGQTLLSGSGDRTARIWDTARGASRFVLSGHRGPILATALSPDGRLAVTASADQSLRLWDATSGRLIATLTGHAAGVTAVAYAPDGRTIVSGDADGSIRLWDGRDGRSRGILARQTGGVAGLAVSSDGRRLITGSAGATDVTVFDATSGRRSTVFTRHQNVVLATAISPDGRLAATAGGNDHEIFLWHPESGAVRHRIIGAGRTVWSVGFARDGRSIAFGNTVASAAGAPYQINGPLDRAFRIFGADAYDLGLLPGRPTEGDYHRAVSAAGPYEVRTENGQEHPTLEIHRSGRLVRRIARDATTGYDHRAFTLTPSGEWVISGGANGQLTAYETADSGRQRAFIGHTGDVLAVAVSGDGALLVSGANDQTVRLWKIATGELLMTLFAAESSQWVAWTPAGYYASSAYGDRYVGWHINRGPDRAADYYPARVFAHRFRSRELLGYYLESGGAFSEAVRRYETATGRPWAGTDYQQLGALAPPRPYFTDPLQPAPKVAANSLRIAARAVSHGGAPVEDIWIAVNGKRVSEAGPIKPKGAIHKRLSGGEATIEVTVPLPARANTIAVLARNRHAVSEPAVLEVERETEEAAPGDPLYTPDLYLLAIGVSENRDPGYALDYAHADAEGVKSIFETQARRLYRNVHARVLTNRDATRAAILDGLDWIYRQTTQRDTAIIFIAGHGLKDDRNNYYFLPYDGDDRALGRSAVPWEAFKDIIENLPARVILMADTCFSGNITGKHRGPKNTMDDAVRELINAGTGAVVFTASTGREQGYEHPSWGHGAFTRALIDGLSRRKADYNKDGFIYIKEIDLYISERVKQLTNGAQHPTTEIPATMPDFPFYSR